MSLVDHDSWDIEYEGCERTQHQMRVLLNQRQQLLQNEAPYSPEYIKLTNNIDTGLEQLRKDVKHLKVMLDNAITWETCSEQELQQRRINLDKLTSQMREIESKYTSSQRSNATVQPSSSHSPWQQDQYAGAAAAAESRPTDMATLKLRQSEILEQQNRGLEVLSATISRQRELATTLGTEVEDQNNILDNITNTLDNVESGVRRETQSIGHINRRDSTWGYWLVIIGLFIAIILVIVL